MIDQDIHFSYYVLLAYLLLKPMYDHSKSLNTNDESGELFTSQIFSTDFQKHFLDIERIQYHYSKKSWVLVDHILIEKPVTDFNHLDESIQIKILRLQRFSEILKERANTDVNLLINLYFPLDSTHKDKIINVLPNRTLNHTTIDILSSSFRMLNHNCSRNTNSYRCSYIDCETIQKQRIDNSSFALSKACLNNEPTFGFNVDKILFFEAQNEIYLFEYLLCEAQQKVNPYTSHPNRYFHKNSQKFINLSSFSEAIFSPMYFLNYAKESSPYYGNILFMKLQKIDPNCPTPVLTTNAKTTNSNLYNQLRNRFASYIGKNHNDLNIN